MGSTVKKSREALSTNPNFLGGLMVCYRCIGYCECCGEPEEFCVCEGCGESD